MRHAAHVVTITAGEQALLDLLRHEPDLIENLRNARCTHDHENAMLQRLRRTLIRAVGAQRTADRERSLTWPERDQLARSTLDDAGYRQWRKRDDVRANLGPPGRE